MTALLFRIEAANRNGLTNPTCTSKECVCTFAADKTAVQPKQISEMVWKASKLSEFSCIIDFPASWEHKQNMLLSNPFIQPFSAVWAANSNTIPVPKPHTQARIQDFEMGGEFL